MSFHCEKYVSRATDWTYPKSAPGSYVNMNGGQSRIKKAFDTVNHDILLKEREMLGLGKSALALLSNYLTDRTKKCHFHNTLSKQRKITCGIPQGNILGPPLYSLYINDLPNCLKH